MYVTYVFKLNVEVWSVTFRFTQTAISHLLGDPPQHPPNQDFVALYTSPDFDTELL